MVTRSTTTTPPWRQRHPSKLPVLQPQTRSPQWGNLKSTLLRPPANNPSSQRHNGTLPLLRGTATLPLIAASQMVARPPRPSCVPLSVWYSVVVGACIDAYRSCPPAAHCPSMPPSSATTSSASSSTRMRLSAAISSEEPRYSKCHTTSDASTASPLELWYSP